MDIFDNWHHDTLLKKVLTHQRVLLYNFILHFAEPVFLWLGQVPLQAINSQQLRSNFPHCMNSDLLLLNRWRTILIPLPWRWQNSAILLKWILCILPIIFCLNYSFLVLFWTQNLRYPKFLKQLRNRQLIDDSYHLPVLFECIKTLIGRLRVGLNCSTLHVGIPTALWQRQIVVRGIKLVLVELIYQFWDPVVALPEALVIIRIGGHCILFY